MTFTVKFDTDNAAFEDEQGETEIARILRDIADRVESGEYCGKFQTIRDLNGNDVGRFVHRDEASA